MIRNKYKIEKKSALELKAEDAAAKAAELRQQLQDALDEGQKVRRRTRRKAAKTHKKIAKQADKRAALVQKKAKKVGHVVADKTPADASSAGKALLGGLAAKKAADKTPCAGKALVGGLTAKKAVDAAPLAGKALLGGLAAKKAVDAAKNASFGDSDHSSTHSSSVRSLTRPGSFDTTLQSPNHDAFVSGSGVDYSALADDHSDDHSSLKAPAGLAGLAAAGLAAAAASGKAEPVVDKAQSTVMDEVVPRIVDVLKGLADQAGSVKETVADKAAAAADTARETVADARDDDSHGALKAVSGLFAADKAAPLVDRISERASEAADTISGTKAAEAESKRRSGTVLMVLGLAAAAAAAALTAMKQSQPKEDPWATPLLDPYTPSSTGTAGDVTSVGSQGAATVAFSEDAQGTDVDLTPAESAQGGDTASVLEPVENQTYPTDAVSDAATTPVDDGAGELLDDKTQVIKLDENGQPR